MLGVSRPLFKVESMSGEEELLRTYATQCGELDRALDASPPDDELCKIMKQAVASLRKLISERFRK